MAPGMYSNIPGVTIIYPVGGSIHPLQTFLLLSVFSTSNLQISWSISWSGAVMVVSVCFILVNLAWLPLFPSKRIDGMTMEASQTTRIVY